MRRIEYFIICNLYFVIIALISWIFFTKESAHIGLTATFIFGEPLILFLMYKLEKDITPRCTSTNNFWIKEGYQCSLKEGHKGMHSNEHEMMDGTKGYYEWN